MLKQCPTGQVRVSRTCRHNVLMSRFRKSVPVRSDELPWLVDLSSGGRRRGEPMAQVYGSPRVYVSDDTDARDDGKRGVASTTAVCAFVPNGTDARDDGKK